MTLAGKVALVTGASRGIGRGIALALGRAGAAVAVGYQSNRAGAEEVARALAGAGGRGLAVRLSVEDRASVRRALAEVKAGLGDVDILVNNAAIAQEKPFDAIEDDDWDRMMAVNLRGAFICSQEVLPGMLARGWGRIVNIASIGGQWGGINQVHYAVSKAGLVGLTRSLAKVYSGRGVLTNAVAPGLVRTDMSGPELASEAGRAKVAAIPQGRVAAVEEVASVVVFLAGEDAGYVTGQTINVNGGMYMG
jgi:NAD(P)-dependent dehydrogenase (short-subunit alcohol dehydrogenase family)